MSYFLPFEPRIPLRPAWGLHLRSWAILLAVSVLAGAGPAARAARTRVAEALRHV
jgi:ABC-type lipoprotein release transport system permease subunit